MFSGVLIDVDKIKKDKEVADKKVADEKEVNDKKAIDEKIINDQKIKDAKEKADIDYQKFLADNGYNETNKELFIIEETADSYRLFSKSLLAEHRK